ncbi:GCN5-related N-acetyltransferase [Arcticibacter svalbardensis MN12-7]|uniref:GCN5-related N-acetyltransferase n=1 Tax=Arcticibacter svalbardensis MN12-7 TaxID=1150600 RepID=R9GRF1_9SPHI|nr:GCN5-related N-acetyltransferase [Arcticibacter svalbardensis MN12-7]
MLITPRLILRPLCTEDAYRIHLIRSDKDLNKYLDRRISTGIADAEAHILMIENLVKKKQSMNWAIVEKEEDILIGTIGFWNFDVENEIVEIGYELLPSYQGKGLMIEAMKQVIKFGFEQMNAQSITAFPSVENRKSIALLERAKFSNAHTGSIILNPHESFMNMATYILNR